MKKFARTKAEKLIATKWQTLKPHKFTKNDHRANIFKFELKTTIRFGCKNSVKNGSSQSQYLSREKNPSSNVPAISSQVGTASLDRTISI